MVLSIPYSISRTVVISNIVPPRETLSALRVHHHDSGLRAIALPAATGDGDRGDMHGPRQRWPSVISSAGLDDLVAGDFEVEQHHLLLAQRADLEHGPGQCNVGARRSTPSWAKADWTEPRWRPRPEEAARPVLL